MWRKIVDAARQLISVAYDQSAEGIKRTPLARDEPYRNRQGFFIVDAVIQALWLARIMSPGMWIGSLFAHKGKDFRYHQNPHATDVYLSAVFIFGFVLLFASSITCSMTQKIITVLSFIIILEIVQHHFYLIFLRPTLDGTYRQYSGVRTVINTIMGFINVLNYFALVYIYGFRGQFKPELEWWSAWAFSAGQISGSGYNGVIPVFDAKLSLVSASEQIIGIFFLAIILALALGRISMKEIGSKYREYDPDGHGS